MIKVIAFDVFNTVVDLSSVPRQEVIEYAHHIRKPEWSPLTLPKSWESLPAFPDSLEGLRLLSPRFEIVTCSNGSLPMLYRLSRRNGIQWSTIVPLEINRVYKPNPAAYMTVCEVCGVEPHEVAMVTANKDFGDLEASQSLGMLPILIRNPGCPQTLVELAEMFCREVKA